jgi:hypothetical protein
MTNKAVLSEYVLKEILIGLVNEVIGTIKMTLLVAVETLLTLCGCLIVESAIISSYLRPSNHEKIYKHQNH